MFEFMGNCILENRKRKGMTQEQLAEKLGISTVAVSKWERGMSVPKLEVVCQLADYFQMSVDELLGRKKCLLIEEEKFSDKAMKQFDYNNRKNIIDKYEGKESIVDWLEELSDLDDRTTQLILKELNNTTLICALAGASGKVCRRFMENLSGRMLFFLDKNLQVEKFELEKIEIAQKAVLQINSIVSK